MSRPALIVTLLALFTGVLAITLLSWQSGGLLQSRALTNDSINTLSETDSTASVSESDIQDTQATIENHCESAYDICIATCDAYPPDVAYRAQCPAECARVASVCREDNLADLQADPEASEFFDIATNQLPADFDDPYAPSDE